MATETVKKVNWQGRAAKDRPERLVNLSMFMENGHLINVDGQTGAAIMRTMPYVTLGRTYSKRASDSRSKTRAISSPSSSWTAPR